MSLIMAFAVCMLFSIPNSFSQSLNDDGSSHTVGYTGGSQTFNIPNNAALSSVYFDLDGADGGEAKTTCGTQNGGEGANVELTFDVGSGANMIAPGGQIRFVVGGAGASDGSSLIGSGVHYSGGGGGSGVLYRPNTSSSWELLAVAGGGGGSYLGMFSFICVNEIGGQGGRSGESGGNGDGDFSVGSGGSSGNGGGGGDVAGGGGGANSDGGGTACTQFFTVQEGGAGGDNGGHGGTSEGCPGFATADGGFGYGGGGGGNGGGGGGGGYSGGGAGGTIGSGGGGGSYAAGWATSGIKTAGSNGGGDENNGSVLYRFTLNQPPVANCQNITKSLNSSGSVTISPTEVNNGSSDPDGDPLTLSVSPAGFNCSDVGNNTVTLTVSDGIASSTCTATVTVNDVTNPSAVCQNVTVQLNASGNGSTTAGAVNNGSSDACGIASISVNPSSFTCSDVGSNTVTLTVTDNNGNSSTCTATATVQDNVNPNAQCRNVTVQLNAAGNGSTTAAAVNNGSSDACGVAGIVVSPSSFTCNNVGSNTVTLTVTDVNGNTSTCTSTATVQDNVNPNAVCQNVIVQLNAAGNGSTTAAAVNNGSSDACGIASMSVSPNSFNCSNVGANTVTLTVTDNNGNSSLCTATATVQDNVNPDAQCQNVTVQLNAAGNGSTSTGDVDNGSSDACGIASLALDNEDFTCADVGSGNTVTLTVTDNNGNSSTCTSTVTVEDNVNPDAQCQDVTVQLDVNGNGSTSTGDVDNGSSDACGIASLALDNEDFTCADVGSGNTVTLTVTDNNGNSSTCTATVTVEDNVNPDAQCQNVTVQLDVDGNGSTTPQDVDNGSSDACGIASLALDNEDFTCDDVGSGNTVTLTVTDVNGNSSTCSATVTVEDNVNPDAQCQDISVYLGEFDGCTVSITPDQVDNGSNDACGIASLSVAPNSFDASNEGANAVTLTVTDVNGNVSTCGATVTVLRRPTTLTYTGDLDEQYSDYVDLSATLTDALSGNPIEGKTITFTIGSRSGSAVTNAAGEASTTFRIGQAPGNYTVESVFADDDPCWLGSADSDAFEILQEDARVTYIGATFASTSSSSSGEASVLLAATVCDITNSTDAGSDGEPGDISNATVTFIDRDGGAISPAIPVVPLPGDSTKGTVSYEWNVDIGNDDSESFTIGTVVNNYYTRNETEDDAIVTVSKPLDNFITGGGYIILTDSEGTIAGDPDTKQNFGFNIKFNRRGTNLQGRLNVIVRRTESDGILHVYQIKGNRMTSLGFDPNSNYAEFQGKANVTDVTDEDNPISVIGNGNFSMAVTDNGVPGTLDLIAISLFTRQGGLTYSSNWTGTSTAQQNLDGGNIVVHTGNGHRIDFDAFQNQISLSGELFDDGKRIISSAYPNPFVNKVTFQFEIPENNEVVIELLSVDGKSIQFENLGLLEKGVSHTYQLLSKKELQPGTYIYRIISGDYVATGQLILIK